MTTSFSVNYIKAEDIPQIWPYVDGYIAEAMADSDMEYSSDSMKKQLRDEEALLWVVLKDEEVTSVAVSEIQHIDESQILVILALGGVEFKEWANVLEKTFIRYMKEFNLDKMRAYCRPGMAKWLGDREWRKVTTVMEYTNGQA